jgi:DNA-binding transcriptional LysR family regulator
METRQLRYFVALAEELHFARAAARVGIEQSPLSKAISELERLVGVQLFKRSRRRTQLTYAGELLLHDARHILKSIDRARYKLRLAATGRKGHLRVAVCDGIALGQIAKVAAEWPHENPEVEVRLLHRTASTQLRDLCAGDLDLGFTLSACKDPRLHCTAFCQEPAIAIMHSQHPASTTATVSLPDVQAGPLLLLGEASEEHAWLSLLKLTHVSVEYVPSTELLLALAASGYGIGLIGNSLARQICKPDLVTRSLCGTSVTMTTFILRPAECSSTAVSRFIEQALSANRLSWRPMDDPESLCASDLSERTDRTHLDKR